MNKLPLFYSISFNPTLVTLGVFDQNLLGLFHDVPRKPPLLEAEKIVPPKKGNERPRGCWGRWLSRETGPILQSQWIGAQIMDDYGNIAMCF